MQAEVAQIGWNECVENAAARALEKEGVVAEKDVAGRGGASPAASARKRSTVAKLRRPAVGLEGAFIGTTPSCH